MPFTAREIELRFAEAMRRTPMRYSFLNASTASTGVTTPQLTIESLCRAARLLDENRETPTWWLSDTPLPTPTPTPQENKPMNELLEGLEAMIRRVVKEEISDGGVLTGDNSARFVNTMKDAARRYSSEMRSIIQDHLPATPPAAAPIMAGMSTDAFGAQFASFITAAPRAFDEVVKRAVIDQPWFDEAVKSEIANVNDDLRVTSIVNEVLTAKNYVLRADLGDLIDTQLDINDVLTHETLSDKIDRAVSNADFDFLDDQIRSVVSDMDFSVSVSR